VIIIAGCAGIVMGNSILFPGTYSRKVSFQKGANSGLKIVLGTVPLFIIAGFIEGFITRHAGFSAVVDVSIIVLSLVFIIFYFILYPRIVHKSFLNPKPYGNN
jgi:uncharacterized membrane protein SpoIIM required for sporulation